MSATLPVGKGPLSGRCLRYVQVAAGRRAYGVDVPETMRADHLLRALREREFQMTRAEFAAEVNARASEMGQNGTGCTPRLVAAWERGEVKRPRPLYCRVLKVMTGRSVEELGFAALPKAPVGSAAPVGEGEAAGAEDADQVERRAFISDTVASVVGMAADGFRGDVPSKIGLTEVGRVQRVVGVLYAHDSDHGSAALRRDAARALHTAYAWLQQGTYSDHVGRSLRSAVGYLSIAAGWLAYDSGRPSDTRSLYGEALAASRIAEDPGLEAHAFGCLSLLARASGRPREAVSAAQGAQAVARSLGSPRLLSLFHMREAGGWAVMGEQRECDRAIVTAHSLYAMGPSDADPDWLCFFTPAELAGLEALSRADLGQHERAACGAEQSVLLLGDRYARNRALYTADIAVQYAVKKRPEPDAAADAAWQALAFLPEVKSDRLVKSLDDVAGALQRHGCVPEVTEWMDEYRALTRAVVSQGGS